MGKHDEKPTWLKEIPAEAVKFTWTEIMAKLLGTIDPAGFPHVTLIACNRAIDAKTVKWGQFIQGRSKKHVYGNPKSASLYMTKTMPLTFMQVKMDFDRCSLDGADAENFNTAQLLRYNTYVRVDHVYFNTVRAASPLRPLPLGGIVKGMVADAIGIGGLKTGKPEARIPPFGTALFSAPVGPKFLAFIDPADGYPVIVPCFQARAVEGKSIAFPMTQFAGDLAPLQPGAKLAFFAVSFELTSILVKGIYNGIKKSRGIRFGTADVTEVYNSMPPLAGMLYPVKETRPKVTTFQ
nr:hypothetical protein [Candidatus Sigynarchaeum springense]